MRNYRRGPPVRASDRPELVARGGLRDRAEACGVWFLGRYHISDHLVA